MRWAHLEELLREEEGLAFQAFRGDMENLVSPQGGEVEQQGEWVRMDRFVVAVDNGAVQQVLKDRQ